MRSVIKFCIMSPSKYSPWELIHWAQCWFCHCWECVWDYSFIISSSTCNKCFWIYKTSLSF